MESNNLTPVFKFSFWPSGLQLNPNVNSFQRKFVGEVRRCEELEKTFSEYIYVFI